MKRWLILLLCLTGGAAQADISVRDDAGNMVILARPAQRVISLAPHVTELLFAAGGGAKLVGADHYSDYPAAALGIPRVGDHHRIDLERLIALKPDLLVVWLHGGAARQIEALRQLGIPFFYSEPSTLADIPETLQRLGRLMGTEAVARKAADGLSAELQRLGAQYRGRPPVRVFYQVWDQPLYTLNDSSIVSDAIRLCGGENIFGKLPLKAPTVSVEAVLLENPEVLISGDRRNKTDRGLENWKQYPSLMAVARANLLSVDADLMNRASPRIIAAAADLCEKLEQVRSRRRAQP